MHKILFFIRFGMGNRVLGARLQRYYGLGSLSTTKSTAIGFYAAHNAFSLTKANENQKKTATATTLHLMRERRELWVSEWVNHRVFPRRRRRLKPGNSKQSQCKMKIRVAIHQLNFKIISNFFATCMHRGMWNVKCVGIWCAPLCVQCAGDDRRWRKQRSENDCAHSGAWHGNERSCVCLLACNAWTRELALTY